MVVDSSGAHLTSLSDAVQENVSSLVGSDDWVERYLDDASLRPVEKIGGFEAPPPGKPGGSPAASTPEVQVSLELDKGGSPSSVKIVAGILNQAHPNNPANTILVAVCPTEKDKYQDLAAMLERHLPELDRLMREGVLVVAARRAVRPFLTGDLAALCTVLGHKGPNATQPCLWCKSTKAPSIRHTSLDADFGTRQGLTTQRTLRDVEHLDSRRARDSNLPRGSQLEHLSIESRPLFVIDPRQIVVIPLHATQGGTSRLLRLAIESVIVAHTPAKGDVFAAELAEKLYQEVGVVPVPYHGGLFIGRDCHKIAEKSDVVCRLLESLLPPTKLAAHQRAWQLWNKVRRVLNRGAVATGAEMRQFRLDTVAVVTHLKTSFPWLYVSPKLHTLLCHAADSLQLFGSIGLYGEQGLEALHGTYNHARDRYPAPTEAERAAGFVRAMALARDASPAVLRRHAPRRKPAQSGARRAAKVGDKRRRDNKPVVEETESLKDKAKREREKWAGNLWVDAARTIRTYQSRRAVIEEGE